MPNYYLIAGICAIISCSIGVVTFVIGLKKGNSSNSYAQGVKDTRVESELQKINLKIDTELKNINIKLDNYARNTVSQVEYAELSKEVALLAEKFKSLEQRVSVTND